MNYTFSNFSGLKPNKTTCEIVGIGVLNGVQVALCDMKCVNLKVATRIEKTEVFKNGWN